MSVLSLAPFFGDRLSGVSDRLRARIPDKQADLRELGRIGYLPKCR